MSKTRQQTEEAIKGKTADQIKTMVAEALSAAFFAARGLAALGDPFAGVLQTQILAAAEQFPAGREASHEMRASMLGGTATSFLGISGQVQRKGPNKYNPGAKEAKPILLKPEEKEVGRFSAPGYVSEKQSAGEEPPCCGDEEEAAVDTDNKAAESAPDLTVETDLPEVIIADAKTGETKLSRDQLFSASDSDLSGSLSQEELLHTLASINGSASGSRAKSAIAKRIVLRVNQIKANAQE